LAPKLITLASGFEAVTQVRKNNLPTFNRTVPFDHIDGTTLNWKQNLSVPPALSKEQQTGGQAPLTPEQIKSKKPGRQF